MVDHPEPFLDDLLEINPAPSDDAVLRPVWTRLDDLGEFRKLGLRQSALRTRRISGRQPVGAVRVEPMHPVPQGLSIHSANSRGFLATPTFQNSCK